MSEILLYPKPKDGESISFAYIPNKIPKHKIYKFRRKLNNLRKKRLKERKKFMSTFKPRYDEIYAEGIKWMDSLISSLPE